MPDLPVGISDAEISRTLIVLRALGELLNVPTVQLEPILLAAKNSLLENPPPPAVPPGPPYGP